MSPLRILIAATALGALAACTAAEEPAAAPTPKPKVVRIAAVERGPALPPIVATGVVAPRDESRLSFKLGGVIREVTVREGDAVKAGQRLATLETTEIDAGVAQARAAHDKAQRDLERGRQLFADDVITQEQLDDLGTAAALAAAQLDAAQFNRRYAEIVAPSDGRVLRRLAEPRELVAAGQPVLLVSRGTGDYTLKFGLPDRDFVHVRIGDRAIVRFDAWPDRRLEARIIERGVAADPRSGTFMTELEIDVGDGADADELTLASGMIGRAEIAASGTGEAELDYVPLGALVEGSGDSMLLFVYDAQTGRVQARRVAVAFITENRAALREPLPPGSWVVADGAPYLDDGALVRVVD